MKTLNVIPTTVSEISEKWGFNVETKTGKFSVKYPLFVRCNSKGEINWDAALIYTDNELIGRKVNVIFKQKN